jgi:hypothetical protein
MRTVPLDLDPVKVAAIKTVFSSLWNRICGHQAELGFGVPRPRLRLGFGLSIVPFPPGRPRMGIMGGLGVMGAMRRRRAFVPPHSLRFSASARFNIVLGSSPNSPRRRETGLGRFLADGAGWAAGGGGWAVHAPRPEKNMEPPLTSALLHI